MSHFSKIFTSPHLTITVAYVYIIIMIISLYFAGFYEDSDFFNWGPPIKFFNKTITTQRQFYGLHCLIFIHQFINNWVNNVVYPWIINNVQDHKTTEIEYSNRGALLIINLFNVYSEIDIVFVVMGFMSQISFVITVIICNIICGTFINKKYLDYKDEAYAENAETEFNEMKDQESQTQI